MRRSKGAKAAAKAQARGAAGRHTGSGAAQLGRLVVPVALVLLTLLAYLPAMQAGFIWDDDDYVTENQTLRSGTGLWEIWTSPGATPQYYPMVFSIFWLEYRLWGLDATGFHVTNILLHAANAVLLWLLLRRLAVPGAWLAALLFAGHPVQVESVAWVTELKNVLSGLFYLAALLAYLSWDRRNECADNQHDGGAWARTGRAWYLLALVLFTLALLSKTVTATLPAVVVVLLWWRHRRITLRDLVPLLPMLVLGAVAATVTVLMETYNVGTRHLDLGLSALDRVVVAGRASLFYLGKLVWPAELSFFYPRWQIDAGEPVQLLAPLLVVVGFVLLWLARHRLGRGPLAAALFFLVTLLPALGFIDVFPMRYSFVADHFQYLASIGPLTLVAGVVATWAAGSGRLRRLLGRSLPLAVVLVLAVLTWRQTRIYHDAETLWRATLHRNPAAWLAHNNLGCLLLEQGRYEQAIQHMSTALTLNPSFAEAHVSLGFALQTRGSTEQAIGHLERALQLDPENVQALSNLAAIRVQQRRPAAAVELLERAVALAPERAPTWVDLGSALYLQGEVAAAATRYAQAVELDPQLLPARFNLAMAYRRLQRTAEARDQLTAALAIARRRGDRSWEQKIDSQLQQVTGR